MNMLTKIFIGVLVASLGVFGISKLSPNATYDAGGKPQAVRFGSISYPASLDSFTNPSGTSPVTSPSHAQMHTDENNAITALETKLGAGASTPSANTVLFASGASSAWSATPTLTSLTLTNLLATGSSTLQNFTGLQATTTNATSTNFFATTASSTNIYGGALTSCSGSNFLQWTAGKFGCAATGGGTVLTTIPSPNFPTSARNIDPLFTTTNTTMLCGQVVIPNTITINKFSINTGTVAGRGGVAGNVKFALFSEDGQTQKFATTTFISTAGLNSFTLTSPVAVTAGNYYECVVGSSANVDVDLPVYTAQDTNLVSIVTGKPIPSGSTTVTSGTIPSTFTPSSLTYNANSTLVIRYDN